MSKLLPALLVAILAFSAQAGEPGPEPEPRNVPDQPERQTDFRGSEPSQAPRPYSDKYASDRDGATPRVTREPRQGPRLPSQRDDCEPCGSDERQVTRIGGGPVGSSAEGSGTYSRGFNEPLSNAVTALAGDGCEIRLADGIEDVDVTWKGQGREWVQVMREMTQRAGLAMEYTESPCIVAIATSQGVAQSMGSEREPVASSASTGAMVDSSGEPKSSAYAPGEAGGLTYQEYLSEYITVHLRSASLLELLRAVTPRGWEVYPEISNESLLNDTFDFTAENTRGQVMATIEQQLSLVAQPYVESGVLVVSEK